jgi:hypothetical protein
MRKTPWIALLLLFLAAPPVVSAQAFAVGARAGTLGLGGEVALGLSDVIVLRGGLGAFPFDYEGEFDGEDYTVTFPSSIWTAGADLYLGGGGIRLMGGIMGKSDNIEMVSILTGTTEIGGTIYDASGTVTGVLEQADIAPFVGLGFGKHTSGGFGFFLDLGVAFSGEPEINMSATGEIASIPGIEDDLQQEADQIEEDLGSFVQYWPIVSLGFKIPLGGN